MPARPTPTEPPRIHPTASTVSYTANALNQYTAVGPVSPSYDGNGNLANDGTFLFGYDAENRLTIAGNASFTATYTFDAQGRRKSKTVNGTTTGEVGSITMSTGSNLRLGTTSADGSVGTMTAQGLAVNGGDFRVDLVDANSNNNDRLTVLGLANFNAASSITVAMG